jgi:hypothetical protein
MCGGQKRELGEEEAALLWIVWVRGGDARLHERGVALVADGLIIRKATSRWVLIELVHPSPNSLLPPDKARRLLARLMVGESAERPMVK